jgi:hypothetical protein
LRDRAAREAQEAAQVEATLRKELAVAQEQVRVTRVV